MFFALSGPSLNQLVELAYLYVEYLFFDDLAEQSWDIETR